MRREIHASPRKSTMFFHAERKRERENATLGAKNIIVRDFENQMKIVYEKYNILYVIYGT